MTNPHGHNSPEGASEAEWARAEAILRSHSTQSKAPAEDEDDDPIEIFGAGKKR